MAAAPPEVQAVMNRALAVESKVKDELIARITANKANRFNPEWLKQQSVDVLEGMAALVPTANGQQTSAAQMFLGAGGPPPVANRTPQAPLVMPTMSFSKQG
jgi:hypothetical protein